MLFNLRVSLGLTYTGGVLLGFQTHRLRIRVDARRQRSGSFSWVKHHDHRFHRPAVFPLNGSFRKFRSSRIADSLCWYRAEEFGHRYAEFIITSMIGWLIHGSPKKGAERSAQAASECSRHSVPAGLPVTERAMEAPAGVRLGKQCRLVYRHRLPNCRPFE
jgi:hypothetical protein